MKRISIFFLLASLFFTSCSNNDPSPDLTPEFIGTWKSEVVQSETFKTWAMWNISKVSNNEVRVTVTTQYESTINDPESSVEVIDKVKLTDNRTMDFNFDMSVDGVDASYGGTGIITGKKLVIAIKATNKKTGETESISETLTKQ